jgi:cobalt-zinc-cadmium efflux system outer membrane protein
MLRARRGRWVLAAWLALLAPGCLHQDDQVRSALSNPLGRNEDVQATGAIGPASTPLPKVEPLPPGAEELPLPRPEKGTLKKEWLRIPPDLPGANEATEFPLKLPPIIKGKEKEREEAVRKLFPKLGPLGPELEPAPGPDGKALTLADLQAIAAANSPTLRRAMADVVAARGAMIQAGAYPNPQVSYQSSGQGPGGGPMAGGGIQQLIKTGGKLKLAQAAAEMDLRTAEVALRAAQNDLTTAVRSGYFSVLVAQEGILVAHALAQLTDEAFIFQRQIVLRSGEAGPYEPLQIYVQAEQARAALVQARHRYISAWKQLAATLNRREMPPTRLAGRADAAVPQYRYDQARDYILANHTDVQTAVLAINKARYNLRLQEVAPLPDVTVGATVLNDLSPPGPPAVVASVNVGVNIPVWDQNRGAILQARGQLAHAVEDVQRVRNDLTKSLADAMERYNNNLDLVVRYRDKILANQVRAYRAVRVRYHLDPEHVAFADIFTSQQAVASAVQAYLAALQGLWTAVVDVANLLQTDDLYQFGQESCGQAGPPVTEMLQPEQMPAPVEPARPAQLLPPAIPPALPQLRFEEQPALQPGL